MGSVIVTVCAFLFLFVADSSSFLKVIYASNVMLLYYNMRFYFTYCNTVSSLASAYCVYKFFVWNVQLTVKVIFSSLAKVIYASNVMVLL